MRLPLHYDVAWYLLVGHRLLHGAVLGVDVVEINPPIFAYLSIPVAWISERLGNYDAAVFRTVTSLVAIASLVLIDTAFRMRGPEHLRRGFLLVAATALFLLPVEQFGQREHFILAGMLPYTVVAAMRMRGVTISTPLAVTVGMLMAIAVAIKPFYGLAWCGLEGWFLIKNGSYFWHRPESIAVFCGLLVYGILIVLLWPDYLSLLHLLGSTYWHYRRVSFETALLGFPWSVFAVLSLCLGTWSMIRGRDPLVTSILTVATATLGAAVIQEKGWENHYIPAVGMALLLLAVLSGPGASRNLTLGSVRLAAGILGGLAGILILARTILLLAGGSTTAEPAPNLRHWLQKHTHPGDTIAVLTGAPFTPVRLATATRTVLAPRFQSLWPLASAPSFDSSETQTVSSSSSPSVEAYLLNTIVSDVSRLRPAVIAVRPKGGELPNLDVLQFFKQSPTFRWLISTYDSVGMLDSYVVWQRPTGK